MRKFLIVSLCLASATPALARPNGGQTIFDLPYCDEVFAYCLQGHSKADCDRLAAEAKQRGAWRISYERDGYPETDMFTLSIEKKAGTTNTYVETRQFGCHAHY